VVAAGAAGAAGAAVGAAGAQALRNMAKIMTMLTIWNNFFILIFSSPSDFENIENRTCSGITSARDNMGIKKLSSNGLLIAGSLNQAETFGL
jgi:hypothetical protein